MRGGIATPDNLQAGWREHLGVPDLFGCSVQYQPGLTVDQLAAAGRFRNGQISYAIDVDLIAAAEILGYDLDLVRTPGGGYHHTMTARASVSGDVARQLPHDLAMILGDRFRQRANPARVL